MRWSISLNSPGVQVSASSTPLTPEAIENSPAVQLGPDAEGRSALFAARLTPEGLELGMVVRGSVDSAQKRSRYSEWYFHDHAVFYLNPGLDHATRIMFAVDESGDVVRNAEWIVPGEEQWDIASRKLAAPQVGPAEFRRLDGQRFFIRLLVTDSACLPKPGAPVGLAIKAGFNEELIVEPLEWPHSASWCRELPLSFGVLHAEPPLVHVGKLEAHEPAWGGAPCFFTLSGQTALDGPQSGTVRWEFALPTDSTVRGPDIPWRATNGVFEARIPVVLSHRAKWAGTSADMATLKFSISSRLPNDVVWSACYPVGFDAGIIARDRYGARLLTCLKGQEAPLGSDGLPPRPLPDDSDFVNRFRNYVYARLPDYSSRTTSDGAPSDFYLEDNAGAGGAHLDLSAEGYLNRVAEMIASRFPVWQDALCATAAWAFHPLITTHSGAWMRISGCVTVDSIPRLGGCLCSDVAQLCACLGELVCARLKVCVRGYTLGLNGHVATVFESPGGRIVIDGMLGHWYHALDNSRLATLDEMRTQQDVCTRAWYYPRKRGQEFYFGVHDQTLRRWKERTNRFPMKRGTHV